MIRFLPLLLAITSCSIANHATIAADKPSPVTDNKAGATGDLQPLNKENTVQLDAKGKRLLLQSEVVLREGLLEMLVCLKQTKEHEAILALPAKAQIVHAGLLALGAVPGSPVRWEPEYQPAKGQQIDIFLTWVDEQGMVHRDRAQSWVRHVTRRYFVEKVEGLPATFSPPDDGGLKWDKKHDEILWFGTMSEAQRDEALKLSKLPAYQEAIRKIFRQSQPRGMDATWVFAGSQLYVDEKTGEKFYQAEHGDLICVANFATATLDLAVNSSATNDDLMFEACTEKIPPLGTKVIVELIPVFPPDSKPAK